MPFRGTFAPGARLDSLGHPQFAGPSELRLVGERNVQNKSYVTDTGGTYQLVQQAHITVSAVEMVFTNWICETAGVGDSQNANNYTINSCFVVTGAGTKTLTQVTFNGSNSVTIPPGGYAIGRATVAIAAGDTYWIRSYMTPAASGSWPKLDLGAIAYPDELSTPGSNVTGNTNADFTTFLTTFGNVFGPVAVYGLPAGLHSSVMVIGDSIAWGSGDTFSNPNEVGFIYRALYGNKSFQRFALPGENLTQYLATGGARRREMAGRYSDYMICQYGINDMQIGQTTAQIQASMISAWSQAAVVQSGLRVVQTTITPKSSSTDSWATTVNQTTDGLNTTRVAVNGWIRDGAPILAGVAVNTGSSADGTLRTGAVGHPLYSFFEIADIAESARDSGIWKAAGTADGIHPTSAMHILMAAGVTLATLKDLPSSGVAEQGIGGLVLAGASVVKKLAKVVGTSSLVTAGAVTGVKVAKVVGTGSLALAPAAADVKKSPQTATGALALAPVSVSVKRATPTGVGVLVLVGTREAATARPVVGVGTLTLAGTSVSVKRATPTSVGALSLAGTGQAVKKVPQVGAGSLTLAPVVADKKVATPKATGALSLTGTSVSVKRATPVSAGTLALAGASVVKKVATPKATAVLLLAPAGTSAKKAVELGTGTMVLAGWRVTVAGNTAAVVGIGTLGLAPTALDVKKAASSGVAVMLLAPTGLDKKRATTVGTGLVLLAPTGVEGRRATEGGRGALVLAGVGAAARRAPAAGSGALLLVPSAVTVAPTAPCDPVTHRPTGVTARPTGSTARLLAITDRPTSCD